LLSQKIFERTVLVWIHASMLWRFFRGLVPATIPDPLQTSTSGEDGNSAKPQPKVEKSDRAEGVWETLNGLA
jgi:hypothetical protein